MVKKLLILGAALLLLPLTAAAHGSSGYNKYDNCREFNERVRINGKKQRLKGMSCRQYNGDWEFVSYDEYENAYRNQNHHSDDNYTTNNRVSNPLIGVSIGLGRGLYGYGKSRRGYNSSYGSYSNYGHKSRGGSYLKSQRKYNKRNLKKRGGNSFSLLVKKNNNNKR